MKKKKSTPNTANFVAKHDFNRGGFHTSNKYSRKTKHKGKDDC